MPSTTFVINRSHGDSLVNVNEIGSWRRGFNEQILTRENKECPAPPKALDFLFLPHVTTILLERAGLTNGPSDRDTLGCGILNHDVTRTHFNAIGIKRVHCGSSSHHHDRRRGFALTRAVSVRGLCRLCVTVAARPHCRVTLTYDPPTS